MKKILLMLLALQVSYAGMCQISNTFNFNTAGELTSEFNQGGSASNISQSAAGGIGDTGSITVSGSANEVFTTKEGYSVTGEGAIYEFQTYFRSQANSGYGGIGFTSNPNATHSQYAAPSDAIGISVHGGGYIFHSSGTHQSGSWTSSIGDLLNNGSPDDWYLAVFTVEQAANSVFNMEIKIYSANADGTLIRTDPDATQTWSQQNTTMANASIIYSYFAFGGHRITFFDDYTINLQGATIVEEDYPVVTGNATLDTSMINLNGEVTDDRGLTITDRGFVWSTTNPTPTTNDNVVATGTGMGAFANQLNNLTSGTTYYIRSYATNSAGTSYSNIITIIADSLHAGTSELFEMSYYPNPVKNILNIKASHTLESYTIYNAIGKIIATQPIQNPTHKINVSNLSNGLYFIELKGQMGSKTIKIVKQ
jgi:hypothetical protein